MNDRKRIACFFTGGFTELNSMKLFLKKINDQVDYIQLCPTGVRRSKNEIRNRHIDNIIKKHSGLTGQALIDFVLDFIEQDRFREEEYDAILIEDDKDNRFLRMREDGSAEIDKDEWELYRSTIVETIHSKHQEMPVLFLYAAPEVETWFLADWDNGFGKVFKDSLTPEQNRLFSIRFHRYIISEVITKRYEDCLESYGYFGGDYRKLSDEIIKVLDETNFLEDCKAEDYRLPHYSKRVEGEMMLEEIDPQVVIKKCTTFFRSGMLALQAL